MSGIRDYGDRQLLRLWSNNKEKEILEDYADLYAILKTTEKLERAYVRDAISAKDYEPACAKLIAHFKTLWSTLKDSVPDVEQFMAQHNMQCPMAAQRLIYSGIPATLEHGRAARPDASNAAASVAQSVQNFITIMDSVKINMVAIDQILPILKDLLSNLNSVPQLPPDFQGKEFTKAWVSKLHGRPAHYELTEEESRQLTFELESAYNEFMSLIQRG